MVFPSVFTLKVKYPFIENTTDEAFLWFMEEEEKQCQKQIMMNG